MRRNSAQKSGLESSILKQVRSCDGISRVELARSLGLAPSTAGIYVERLITEGFLIEAESPQRDAGRPPRLLRPNPDGGEFIGVDFEARNIMAVAVDFSDKPLRNAHRSIEEGDSVNQIIRKIEEAVLEVLPKESGRLLAIGVGVPGIVDAASGIAVRYKYIAQWLKVPLAAKLNKRFGVPVYLENNVRSMALAEMWFGQGRGDRDFLCIGIRSGIGVGMVLDGNLLRGSGWAAGELGRWHCGPLSVAVAPWFSAIEESAPDKPELQDVASVLAIQKALRKAILDGAKTVLRPATQGVPMADIIRAVQQRDPLTLQVISEAASALGAAIGQLALVLDPAKVMLAGPLTALGETFLEPVRTAVDRELLRSGQPSPEIVNSTMGDFSGALGAAALALHEWRPTLAAPPTPSTPPAKKGRSAAPARG